MFSSACLLGVMQLAFTNKQQQIEGDSHDVICGYDARDATAESPRHFCVKRHTGTRVSIRGAEDTVWHMYLAGPAGATCEAAAQIP